MLSRPPSPRRGIVKDERKIHRGREAIRAWRVEAGQLYSYTAEPFSLAVEEGRSG